MDVIAAGHAGHAAFAHHLAALDGIANVHADFAHVAIDGLQAVTVIDHDTVAVDAERGGIDDDAIVRGFDAYVLRDGEVVAEVHLLIDLFAVVDVIA